MNIFPVTFNTVNTPRTFGQSYDLGRELSKAINKKLQNDEADSFVPSVPSQPIIIEKLEINNQNDKDTSTKKGSGSSFLTGTGAGFVGSEVKDKINDIQNKNRQKEVNIDKMIDETAHENTGNTNEMSIEEITENNEFIDESNDMDSDFCIDDVDE